MSFKRSILFTFLAQAPTLFLYFIASTLMTNVLGEEGRGSFALLQNLTIFISMMLGFNFGLGLMYHTARSNGDHRTSVGMATTGLLVNLFAVPAILAILHFDDRLRDIFFPGRTAHIAYAGYVLATVWLNQVITFIAAIVQGMKLFKILNRMSILAAGLSCTGFALIFIFRERLDPAIVLPITLGVTLMGVVVQTILWTAVYVRRIGLPPVPCLEWSIIRPFMEFAIVGYLINIINLVNYRFDIWVVDQYAGTAQLGLYAVAVGVGQLFFNVPEPLARVVQPYLYASSDDAMMQRFKVVARLNFTAVAVLCAIAALAAPWVLPLLFGEAFAGSVTPLRWLLPGIIFCSAYKLLAVLLTQRGLLRFNLYGSTIAAVTTVVLDLILIPIMGILGAAVASSIAYLAILVVTCIVLRYRLRMPVGDLFLLRPSDLGVLRAMFFKQAGNDIP